ncbi:PREDICTED: SKP1-like protein 13 [Erythranthe guttata]|nr:PREDICTED: SKP1-like protein 13 [Erythranthe guttata]|eukprot:XP_012837718.1 PREDICTED: SKP1-like protein 13 [Erythranthe guttata]
MASSQENDVKKPETTITLKDDEKPETTITLKSSDGEVFEVPESAALLSYTIKIMVEDCRAGDVISLEQVDGKTLSWVITYLKKHAIDPFSEKDKDEFDTEFFSDKEFTSVVDIINAANYLNIKELLHTSTRKIADLMAIRWNRAMVGRIFW